jgi:hypothetical protein
MEKIRVRVAGFVPEGKSARPYAGQIIEVSKAKGSVGNHEMWVDGTYVGNINPKYFTEVGECVQNFEPKSGMTFITIDGRSGLFVGTDKGLVMLVVRKGTGIYETFANFVPSYLKGDSPYHIQSIFEGMNQYENNGLSKNMEHLADTPSSYQKVWSRKKESVRLNDSYTAQIKDGKVFVGCQEISFDAVKELAELVKAEEA